MNSSSTSTLDSHVPKKTTSIKSLPSLQPRQVTLAQNQTQHLQRNSPQRQRQHSLSGIQPQSSMHKSSRGNLIEREVQRYHL